MKTASKKLIDKFATADEFQQYLRDGGEMPDSVTIGDVLFTMDNYDMDGKELTYGNKRTGKALNVLTNDRYKSKADTVVKINDMFFERNDVTYLD